MTRKGKSTPPQREETEKGFPVPVWFVAFIAVATLAIIFGPTLLAGIGENSAADTANSGGSELSQPFTGGDARTSGATRITAEEVAELEEFYANIEGKAGIYYSTNDIPKEIVLLNPRGGSISVYASNFKVEGEDIKFLLTNTGYTPVKINNLYISIKIEDSFPKLKIGENIEIPAKTTVEFSTNGQLTTLRERFYPNSHEYEIEGFKIDTRI